MASLENGRWRIRILRNGRNLSQTLPRGTPKKVVDDIERRLKLGYIDPASDSCRDILSSSPRR